MASAVEVVKRAHQMLTTDQKLKLLDQLERSCIPCCTELAVLLPLTSRSRSLHSDISDIKKLESSL